MIYIKLKKEKNNMVNETLALSFYKSSDVSRTI